MSVPQKKTFLENITYLTSFFPEITFIIIYSKYNLKDVTVWKIKDAIILQEDHIDLNITTLQSGISLDIRPVCVSAASTANIEILDEHFDYLNRKQDRVESDYNWEWRWS